ncbi:MAG: hemolysin family protein [Clostridia bacterium]|nr:hemolysin family protein [Clostridia bacterium]
MDDVYLGTIITVLIVTAIIINLLELMKASLDATSLNVVKAEYENLTDLEERDLKLEKKFKTLITLLERPLVYTFSNVFLMILAFLVFLYKFIGLIVLSIHELSNPICVIIIFLIVLSLAMGICLVLPYKWGIQRGNTIALKLCGLERFLCIIITPFRVIMSACANVFLKMFHKDINVDLVDYSEEDVKSMLEIGQQSGAIKEEGKKMINSIFEFDDKLAYEIMTPRTDVFMIDITDEADEYMEELMELKYSRIPVCEEDSDNIIGILNIKDYLKNARIDGFDNIEIKPILREAFFVPETKNIDSLFKEMQKQKQQIAILIDEYGGFSGIVTLEDIIEEIMGEIDDEYDDEELGIKNIGNGEYIIGGAVDLDDLNEELGLDLESDNSETIGGFIIDLLGEIPADDSKQKLEYKNLKFLVIDVKDRRIEKLKLTIGEERDDELE